MSLSCLGVLLLLTIALVEEMACLGKKNYNQANLNASHNHTLPLSRSGFTYYAVKQTIIQND